MSQGSREGRVVEKVGQLAMPPLDELEHGQVALVIVLAGIGRKASDLGKHMLAEALDGQGMQLADESPIGFG